MRRNAALCLCLALLALAACGRQSATRDADLERETAALRARVERLEREAGQDRARLDENIAAMREDLGALRASLEEASRHVAALTGQDPPAIPGPAAKSPRTALRESLHKMLETTRQALDRLNLELDKSLGRAQRPEKSVAPAQ